MEDYTDLLSRRCDTAGVPNEFLPHHGNLSRDIREHTESRLKDRSRPTTAVCTSTLEMGIDIGSVSSIAQVGAPPSVAPLRQRLGRSGRRGGPAVLRLYISEPEPTLTIHPGLRLPHPVRPGTIPHDRRADVRRLATRPRRRTAHPPGKRRPAAARRGGGAAGQPLHLLRRLRRPHRIPHRHRRADTRQPSPGKFTTRGGTAHLRRPPLADPDHRHPREGHRRRTRLRRPTACCSPSAEMPS
ncbi:helicase-related protein [Streptosporangium sp. NPDC087985]|uniref:helicase-related protein n=1 Tax=Streptosporangium sp. NPDC087985 TaxID=3366196 RepID=UPI003817940A